MSCDWANARKPVPKSERRCTGAGARSPQLRAAASRSRGSGSEMLDRIPWGGDVAVPLTPARCTETRLNTLQQSRRFSAGRHCCIRHGRLRMIPVKCSLRALRAATCDVGETRRHAVAVVVDPVPLQGHRVRTSPRRSPRQSVQFFLRCIGSRHRTKRGRMSGASPIAIVPRRSHITGLLCLMTATAHPVS